MHTAGKRHALQKINDVTITQHNSVPLCPALHHRKRGRQSRRPRQSCQFRTFSCASAIYSRIVEPLFPKEPVPASTPVPPSPRGRDHLYPNHGVSVRANRLPARIFRAVASPTLVSSSSSRTNTMECSMLSLSRSCSVGGVVVGQSRRATAVKTTRVQRACPPPSEEVGGVRPI